MAVQIPEELLSSLLAGEKFLIFTHLRPDGDAIGSAFGMRSFLTDQGKTAHVLLPADPPERYLKFGLEGALRTAEPADYDTFVALDCATQERIADAGILARLTDKKRFFSLDHHLTNTGKSAFYDFVDPKASSACEIAASLAFQSGLPFSRKTANFFLAGMMTDTGGFKFSNTNGSVLRTAALLLDAGADLENIVNILFFSKSERQLRFESALISQIKTACSGRFAYAYIPQEMLDKYNFSLKEDEGLIDILRGMEGVVIAMLVHRQPDGFKISLRSKDPQYPVAPIAAEFGGGGHLMAAGATLDFPDFNTVEQTLLSKISAFFHEKNSLAKKAK